MKGNLWQVVLIALALALLGPLLINGAMASSSEQYNKSETVVVNYTVDSEVNKDPDEVWNLSDTVTITQGGTELDNTTDYNWNPETGVINWTESADTTEDDTATVDYSYWDHSDRTKWVAQLFRWNVPWIGLLFLITVMGFLKVFAIGSGGPF